MTTGTPSESTTTLRFLIAMVPSTVASTLDCSAPRWAAPPMWKVRMVSWVPGSPIDWAAMTPTASPTLTEVPARQVAAVADRADAATRLTGQSRADHNRIDSGTVDLADLLLVDQIHRPFDDHATSPEWIDHRQ